MKRPLVLPAGKAALLLVDLQEEHRRDPRYLVEGYERVLSNARQLQIAARGAGIPVLHCAYIVDPDHLRPFHPVQPDGKSVFSDRDDPLTAVCPEVAPAPGEALLIKSEASAFGDGRLMEELRRLGVEWLVVCGVWTEACVDATVKHAVGGGFRVLLVKDACGSGTATMHQVAILNLANRLYGGAVTDTAGALTLLGGAPVEAWMVEGAVPLRFTLDTVASLFDAL